MNTMKAIRIHTYGDFDVLKYEEAPCPEEGDNEVLIRVSATGVNPYDWKVRAGYLAGCCQRQLDIPTAAIRNAHDDWYTKVHV